MRLTLLIFICFTQITFAQFKQKNLSKEAIPASEARLLTHLKVSPSTQANNNEAFNPGSPISFYKNDNQNLQVLRSSHLGVPSYIQLEKSVIKNNDDAKKALLTVFPLFKLDTNKDGLRFQKLIRSHGIEQVSYVFQQTHRNVPIYYSDLRLHVKDDEKLLFSGNSYPSPSDLNTNPKITPEEAHNIVNQTFGLKADRFTARARKFVSPENDPSLIIYHKDRNPQVPILAYHISTHVTLKDKMEVFINANTGEIIHKFKSTCEIHPHTNTENTIMTVNESPATANTTDLLGNPITINTYNTCGSFYMIDASRSMFNAGASSFPDNAVGVIETIDAGFSSYDDLSYSPITSSNNNWSGQATAATAHHNAGKAYEYFENVHNRNSINGQGGNIFSLINVNDEFGNSFGNAFWNGIAMFYGNGDSAFFPLARALDVAGHEMSHGVIQSTANLEYQGESGAINESYADVFGAMIDRDDWKIGEDVVRTSAFPSGALRDMEDPHNGQSTGNFGAGWQPKHVNEQFTGSQDNGGVHINSGIPNHAFFLFANAVGKDRAEEVYYHALTTYLTRSSQFVDLRNAIEQSALDLHGPNVQAAAQDAFSQVGIGPGSGGDFENDVNTNNGDDWVLYTSENQSGIRLYNVETEQIFPISLTDPISKPSISDDGEEIVFIGTDNHLHYIFIDWGGSGNVTENILSSSPVWRNAIISKDGRRIGLLFNDDTNRIAVFDFMNNIDNVYELFNPTFTDGVSTGDVLYADAMEFDFSGDFIMYDAINQIQSNDGQVIEYWDIGFIQIWNPDANTWTFGDNISKLFSALPEGVSVGNPTFSKNSPYIVALDYIDAQGNAILGTNIERGEINTIFDNNGLGYPSYSRTDEQMLFDFPTSAGFDIGILDLNDDKISTVPNTEFLFLDNSRWATWFGNGERVLSSIEESATSELINVFPNPTSEFLNIDSPDFSFDKLQVVNQLGVVVDHHNFETSINDFHLDVRKLASGYYFLQLIEGNKVVTTKFLVNAKY